MFTDQGATFWEKTVLFYMAILSQPTGQVMPPVALWEFIHSGSHVQSGWTGWLVNA